jgi:hypothetical protein
MIPATIGGLPRRPDAESRYGKTRPRTTWRLLTALRPPLAFGDITTSSQTQNHCLMPLWQHFAFDEASSHQEQHDRTVAAVKHILR